MSHIILTVKYTTHNNNFCYISFKNHDQFKNGVLKVQRDNGSDVYFTSKESKKFNDDEIGVNCLQAIALGLNENDNVMVSCVDNVPSISKLTVSPSSMEDYEMVEILSSKIENFLLEQIRVVNINQKFVIFVSDSIHPVVTVDSIDPVSPGLLYNLTSLAVAYPAVKSTPGSSNLKKLSFHEACRSLLTTIPEKEAEKDVFLKYSKLISPAAFRLYPIEELKKVQNSSLEYFHHFTVFANEKYFGQIDSDNDVYNLKFFKPTTDNLEDTKSESKELTVRVCVLKDCVDYLNFPTLYVHQCIFDHFHLQIGAKVVLKSARKIYSKVNSIEIVAQNSNEKAIENLKKYMSLSENEKLILNSNVILNFNSDFVCSLKFSPSTSSFCVVNPDFIRNCKFVVAPEKLVSGKSEKGDKKNVDTERKYCENVANFDQIIKNAISGIKTSLSNPNCDPQSVIFTGKSGSGKSTLLEIIKNKLFKSPYYIYSEFLSCKNLKGKSLDSLEKHLDDRVRRLIFYQPSVFILDDLHVICEATISGEAVSPESLQFERISEMFAHMYQGLIKNHKIAIIATAESLSKLNERVFSSRGQHLFKSVVNIEQLTMADRTNALNYLFTENGTAYESVDVEKISLKTEGFVLQDLVDFVDKAIFESIKEGEEEVTNAHCEVSLKSTIDLSLKDVNLHSPGDKDFSDIGGLEDAKKILVESMMWPLQYPDIFENSPLRIQSGLLLYGPPGTGKTILAAAAAKQCGLRLISVKGPELLSKYIGASEESVRNIFQKAQSAKPCILFFDEFDSLAPKRGHDSTGVTDRVVNQILTQLDGVESLTGVCVLAATSKPNLIDPALLRPGRLDKQIYCPLPDKETRNKILQALAKNMNVTPEVNLSDLAEKTDGFTGADLQSILRTAQLAAADSILKDFHQNKSYQAIEINENHVDEALKSTRPSISRNQQKMYDNLYGKFQRRGAEVEEISQRVTLA